jgi:O-antigen/teichoic acid export membrane protein
MAGAFLVTRLERFRFSGTSALALSTVITNLVRLVSTIVLTRLLSPDVYGITGIIMSVFYTINMITDVGLQAYVVRHDRSDEKAFLDAVYTMHAARGLGLAFIGIASAWPLAFLLGKPEILAPLAVASLVFVVDGQVSLHQFKALRAGAVQRFAMIDLINGVTQTASAIALAFLFRNVWAIVGSLFVASAVRVWATYFLFGGIRHSIRFDRAIAADLWRFSRVVGVSSTLTLAIAQLDKLALGRILTLSEFGTFVIASSLAAAPTVFAFKYASTIVYPAIARAWRNDQSIRNAYYGCWGRFFYLYAFGGGGLIGVSGLLVALLYDDRYLAAGDYLAIFGISTAFSIVTRPMEAVQVASGRQRAAIEFNVLRLICLGTGAAVALARSEPMVLVFALGLLEGSVYCYGLLRMSRLQQVIWRRELAFLATVAAGFMVGWTVKMAAFRLFAHAQLM